MPMEWINKKKQRKANPELIIKLLLEKRTFDDNGDVVFNGFGVHEHFASLAMMMDINEDINSELLNGLVSRALWDAAKKKKFNQGTIKNAVNKVLGDYLKQDKSKFFLLTTVNISTAISIPKTTINGCHIAFHKSIPKVYKNERAKVITEVSSWLIEKDEPLSLFILVSINELSKSEALHKMMNAMNLLRGIWNLHLNPGLVVFSSGRKKPINKITFGALYTIHLSDNDRTCGFYWYDESHYKDHNKVTFIFNQKDNKKQIKSIRDSLKKKKYYSNISEAIIRYVKALDSTDHNLVIFKLWAILEFLTSKSDEYANYNKTIDRTKYIFTESSYHNEILENLKKYRNELVHAGSESDDIGILVYQAKGYVESLIWFHLNNKLNFNSIDEVCDFLDLSIDETKLNSLISDSKESISKYKAKLKFITNGK